MTDVTGCSASDDVTVTVNPLPTILAGPDTLVCEGENIQMNASGGATYTWDPPAGLSAPNISNPILTVTGTQTFTITSTDANGCTNSTSTTITLDPPPTVDAGEDTVVFEGESVMLDGTTDGSFVWTPATGLSDPTILAPNASPSETTTYYLVSTSTAGCEKVDSVTITVIIDPIVAFPNAFSPNSDGQNDFYEVITRGPVNTEAFTIYNRWGQIVFETADLAVGWDGTYKGKDLSLIHI